MPFTRGNIVKIFFEIPNYKKEDWHPGLIISNDGVFLDDECYVVVMLTGSSEFNDKYTFEIEDKMLSKPLPKKSQVRCHILANILPSRLIDNTILATMKPDYVDAVVQRINDAALSEEY